MSLVSAVASVVLVAAPPANDVAWALNAAAATAKELTPLYIELHQAPELSLQEVRTAEKLATQLRRLGFEVTAPFGGNGVVGVLRNGPGPTVMLRTDLDGLPVLEKTGLPYASRQTAKDDSGSVVPTMHACGHDVHMTTWAGVATVLSKNRDRWHGTLLMIGQPAEERGLGAKAMLAAGLFKRFPKPDYALAVHVTSELPSGQIAAVPGHALANVDSVDITIHGKGGHGAAPHKTVDPIVLGSKIVLALQTLVSREIDPKDQAVVTVGSFQSGTKHNIVPDDAKLQLTVRSYKDEVRKKLLSGIERIAKGEAIASGAPKPPEVKVSESLGSTHNDPELTRRVTDAVARALGPRAIGEMWPIMGAEDFGEYGRAGVKALIFWVGAAEPAAWKKAQQSGVALPTNHSPLFAPDRDATLRTGTQALTVAALDVLSESAAPAPAPPEPARTRRGRR
jgi:amidohydrolase